MFVAHSCTMKFCSLQPTPVIFYLPSSPSGSTSSSITTTSTPTPTRTRSPSRASRLSGGSPSTVPAAPFRLHLPEGQTAQLRHPQHRQLLAAALRRVPHAQAQRGAHAAPAASQRGKAGTGQEGTDCCSVSCGGGQEVSDSNNRDTGLSSTNIPRVIANTFLWLPHYSCQL